MAYSAITVTSDAADGAITATSVDAANGNKYQNSGSINLLIHNPNAGSYTLTIRVPADADTALADGNTIADRTIATSEVYYTVHKLPPSVYNVRSGTDAGAVLLDWGGTTTGIKLIVL